MRHFLLCLIGCLGLLAAQAQSVPLSPRIANYNIALTLDTATHQVQATQRIVFRNPSGDTLRTVPFHLYYNAFKNNRTIFYQEAEAFFRRKSQEDIEAGRWSWLDITTMRDGAGRDLKPRFRLENPSNPYDHTVLEVDLLTPILPYDTAVFALTWHSQIPKASIRTGYLRDYYFMAQWFPKLGVYEPVGTRFATEGQWNCHPYHANTEYYSDFGVYEVAITVPTGFVVGASGTLQQEETRPNGQTTYHYRAADVIDFTWTACPRYEIVDRPWNDVNLRLFITPEHQCNQDRFFDAATYALDFLASYLEPYPYPQLTMVSPPYYGLFSGAMEYPTLFTAPTLCLLPANVRTTETLTIHELIHQYFMQIVASNEQEEAWLDEGFTAFFESKIMDRYYPKGVFYWDYLGMEVGSMEYRRGRFMNADNPQIGPMSQPGWRFKHGGHREIVYGKGAIGLHTLEGLLGERCFRTVVRTYYENTKFKHPSRLDFIAAVQEVVPDFYPPQYGALINRYVEEWIYGTSACDYAVHSISNNPLPEPLGHLSPIPGEPILPSDTAAPQYRARTILYRWGELTLPQQVRIVFDDGSSVLEFWDGQARSHDFTYEGPRKIVSVEIDPGFQRTMDQNIWNNSRTTQPQTQGIWRFSTGFFGWFQSTMVALSSFI